MNPWEEYADTPEVATQESGNPWDEYAQAGITENKKKVSGDTVVEEQHPDVSFADRAIIKNLSQSPKASVMYLVKKHPNADVKLSKDGRILFKRPEEREYKVVDPKGFDMQDITDIGADVASGITEGAATIGGAALGGAMGGGVGAIPGAMVTSGTVGGVNEYLRQRLGKALGIPQEVDYQDVAMSGGLSAVSPLIFGAGGKIGTQLLKQGAKGASAEIAERGLLGAGARKATTKAGEMFTGVNNKVFQRATDPNVTSKLDEISEMGEEVFANAKLTELDDAIMTRQKEVGKEIGEKLRMSGKQIDISAAKKAIKQQIKSLRKKQETKVNLSSTELEKVNFPEDVFEVIDSSGGKIDTIPENIDVRGLSSSDKAKLEELTSLYNDAFKRVNANGQKFEIEDLVDAEEAFDVKDILAQNADFLKTPNKGATLAESKKATYLKSVSKNASGAYGELKGAIENALSEAPALNKKFRESLEDIDYFTSKFRNKKSLGPNDLPSGEAFTEKGYKLLRQVGYENPGKKDIARKISQLDARYGTNVLEEAKNISASDFKKNASLAQVSGLGTTSTSRTLGGQALGAGAGAYLGSQLDAEGGRPLGGMIGLGLGAFLTSPKAFRTYLQMQNKMGTPMDPRVQQTILNMIEKKNGE